jgi:hypothetical protein
VLSGAQQQQLTAAGAALDGALDVIQRAGQSSAGAVNKLVVRLAAGNDRLALLVRRDQAASDAATRLATLTFDRLKIDPNIGRAEALRQAMLSYLNDASSPKNAYPALWGPFALIGEGAAR